MLHPGLPLGVALLQPMGTRGCGITPAVLAGGPVFNPQWVRFAFSHVCGWPMLPWPSRGVIATELSPRAVIASEALRVGRVCSVQLHTSALWPPNG